MPYVSIAADILMIAASSGAAIYCLILSRRLSRLSSFDKGIGGAIAVLSAQVDEMKAALAEARLSSAGAGDQLQDLVRQAREISGELELMIAACHDFAEEAMVVQAAATVQKPLPIVAEGNALGVDWPASIAPEKTPQDPLPTEMELAAPPMFGSRRAVAAQPVFLRHGQG